MVDEIKGGLGKEPWYKSRRVWGILMTAAGYAAYHLVPEPWNMALMTLLDGVAVTFNIQSWIRPKAK